MGRAIVGRIYTAIAVSAVSAIAGFLLRRVWRLATGGQPPDLKDPDSPIRPALAWLVLSSLVASLASLAVTRGTGRASRRAAGRLAADQAEAATD